MKASGAISESGVSGRISGSKGGVGITPTGIELAINAGVGQLGISTDYGGGVVIGIGGQKITWGTGGGKIHYNLFGFELIVEARDCIVVETRKIAGQIVASHTYPDPGCKPLPLPKKKLPDPVEGAPPNLDNEIELADTDEIIYCFYLAKVEYYLWERIVNLHAVYEVTSNATSEFTYPLGYYLHAPVSGVFEVRNHYNAFENRREEWTKGRTLSAGKMGYYEDDGSLITVNTLECRIIWQNRTICFYDTSRKIKAFMSGSARANRRNIAKDENRNRDAGVSRYFFFFPTTTSLSPPPSAGNRPPMPQDCCKQLAADLADLKEVLATKEILQGKLTFPWRLRMPGGQGEEVIKNYPNLARAMVQVIDHLGIHPPKLSIKDINNAIAGDQSISNQFPCATQGFEALMAQVWDANADVDTLTNFLYRLSWLCVQQSMNLAVVSADIQSIKDMIGGKTTPDKATITTPFNIGAGVKETTKGKGFGKNKNGEIDRKIDANTELSTESLLPDFLKIRDNDIIIERYTGDKDVVDMLSLILLKLETLSAR